MKLALVFPGQGSQSVGMMQAYEGLPGVQETFSEASEVLNQDLWGLVTHGPAERLNQTINTQPVMLAADVAVYRGWSAMHKVKPDYLAGHSLGEYAALVAGNALDFKSAVALVRHRATLMQAALPTDAGAMAVVLGLDDEVVEAVCAEAGVGEIVEAVNYNSPGQVVIAGHKNAVARAMALATDRGAKRVMILPVSVPAHSSLMTEAAQQLGGYLESVNIVPPDVPVLQNAEGKSYASVAGIKDALVRQLYSPVRWVDTIQTLARYNVSHIIECGPAKVLTGLNKRSSDVAALALNDIKAINYFKTIN